MSTFPPTNVMSATPLSATLPSRMDLGEENDPRWRNVPSSVVRSLKDLSNCQTVLENNIKEIISALNKKADGSNTAKILCEKANSADLVQLSKVVTKILADKTIESPSDNSIVRDEIVALGAKHDHISSIVEAHDIRLERCLRVLNDVREEIINLTESLPSFKEPAVLTNLPQTVVDDVVRRACEISKSQTQILIQENAKVSEVQKLRLEIHSLEGQIQNLKQRVAWWDGYTSVSPSPTPNPDDLLFNLPPPLRKAIEMKINDSVEVAITPLKNELLKMSTELSALKQQQQNNPQINPPNQGRKLTWK